MRKSWLPLGDIFRAKRERILPLWLLSSLVAQKIYFSPSHQKWNCFYFPETEESRLNKIYSARKSCLIVETSLKNEILLTWKAVFAKLLSNSKSFSMVIDDGNSKRRRYNIKRKSKLWFQLPLICIFSVFVVFFLKIMICV